MCSKCCMLLWQDNGCDLNVYRRQGKIVNCARIPPLPAAAHNTVSGNLNHWPDTLSCAQQTGSQQYTHFEEIVYQGIHDSVSAVPQHEVPQHEVPLPLSTVIRYKFRASLTRQSGDVRGEAIMLYRVVALLTTMLYHVAVGITYHDHIIPWCGITYLLNDQIENVTTCFLPPSRTDRRTLSTAATRGDEQSI